MKSSRKRRKFKISRTSSRLKYSRRIRRRGGAAGPAGPAHKTRIPIDDYIKMLRDAKSEFLTKRVDKFYGIFGHATSLSKFFKLNADLLFLTPYACSTQSTTSPYFIHNVNSTQDTLNGAYRRVYSSDSASYPRSASVSVSDRRGRNGESFLHFLDAMIHPMGYNARGKTTLMDFGKYRETSVLRLHCRSGPGERIINTQVLASRPPGSSNGSFEGIIKFDLTSGVWTDVTREFALVPTSPANFDSAAAAEIQKNTPYTIQEGSIPPYVWNTRDLTKRYKMITIKSLIDINPKYKNETFVSFGCRTAEPGVDPLTAITPKLYKQPSPDGSSPF